MGDLLESGSQTTETSSQRKIPDWLKSGSQDAVGLATNLSGRQFDPEAAAQGLGGNDMLKSGFLSAQGFEGSYAPYMQEAGESLAGADRRFTDADLGGYMNPYIESALDPAAREMTEQFEAQRNQRNMESASRGAFGGLRGEIGNDLAEESYLEGIGDLYRQGMSGAWDRAGQLWQQDRAQQQDIASQYQGLAGQSADLRRAGIDAKLGAGQMERGIDESLYAEERDWGKQQQLSPLLSALGTVPHGSTQTGTSTQSQEMGLGGALAQGAGIAATAYGASSRDYKTDKAPVEGSVLDKIETMPVESWRYKGTEGRHVGPYAEDYAEQFGGDGKRIPPTEAVGVQWAGLQEAGKRLKALEDAIHG